LADVEVPNPSAYLNAYTDTLDYKNRLASYRNRRKLVRNIDDSEPIITYRDVCSLLFPEDFNYQTKDLCIKYGILVSGEFNKKNIGTVSGSITHLLSFYRSKRAALFINDVGRICDTYTNSSIVSFNPSDMIHPEEYYAEISQIVNSTRDQLQELLKLKAMAKSEFERERIETKIALLASAPMAEIKNTIGQTKNNYERKLAELKAEGASKEKIEKCIKEGIDKRIHNVFEIMYKSGCRGSEENARQIEMTLGVQYTGSERTNASNLAWIRNKNVFSSDGIPVQNIIANGIIDSSFMNGLTPAQYAVHSAPVRLQVVTGKTEIAGTGYIGKQMSSIYSQFHTAQDMCVVTGDTVIAYAMGGFLDPRSLLRTSRNGHTCSTFIDCSTLVGSVNYLFNK